MSGEKFITKLKGSDANDYILKGDLILRPIVSTTAGVASKLSTKWNVNTVNGLSEPYDGMTIAVRVPSNRGVTTAGTVLSIDNGTTYHPISYNVSALTTQYATNSTIILIYNDSVSLVCYLTNNVSETVTGVWQAIGDYDSNTNTIGYQLRTNSSTMTASDKFYRYRLLFTSADGTQWVPANTSTLTNATGARTPNTRKIDPFGEIVWYGTTSVIEQNAIVGATVLWQQYYSSSYTLIGYSFNNTGAAATMTANLPIYVVCTPQNDGSAIIDSTTPYTQTLPTTEDGKIYIYLGRAVTATTFEILMKHPIYWYKNGKICLYTAQDCVNTTYTFTDGTNSFTVTPSGGTAQTVNVTPSITDNALTTTSISGSVTGSTSTSDGSVGGTVGSPTVTVTKKTVTDALGYTPPEGPMVFKGTATANTTAGTTGTPFNPSTKNIGDTYKIIAGTGSNVELTVNTGSGTTANAKIGDSIICTDKTNNYWCIIPSGDEPSGTVTSVAVGNNGLLETDISGNSAITTSGTISHKDVETTSAVSTEALKKITTDGYGHIKTTANATSSDITGVLGYTPASDTHVHGNITNGGALQTTDITIATGDKLVVTDSSDSNKVARSSVTFDTTDTETYLSHSGTWDTPIDIHQEIDNAFDTVENPISFLVTGVACGEKSGNPTFDTGFTKPYIGLANEPTTDNAVWVQNTSTPVGSGYQTTTKLVTPKLKIRTSGNGFARIDTNGDVTASALTSSEVTTALGYTPSSTDTHVNVTGDATTTKYLLGTSVTPSATVQNIESVSDTSIKVNETVRSIGYKINVDANYAMICGMGIAKTANIGTSDTNTNMNMWIRAMGSNPIIGFRCSGSSQIWYFQATSTALYLGPTSSSALWMQSNGRAGIPNGFYVGASNSTTSACRLTYDTTNGGMLQLYTGNNSTKKVELKGIDGTASFASTVTAGNIIDSGLTASKWVKTDANKQLVSADITMSDLPSSVDEKVVITGSIQEITQGQNLDITFTGDYAQMAIDDIIDDVIVPAYTAKKRIIFRLTEIASNSSFDLQYIGEINFYVNYHLFNLIGDIGFTGMSISVMIIHSAPPDVPSSSAFAIVNQIQIPTEFNDITLSTTAQTYVGTTLGDVRTIQLPESNPWGLNVNALSGNTLTVTNNYYYTKDITTTFTLTLTHSSQAGALCYLLVKNTTSADITFTIYNSTGTLIGGNTFTVLGGEAIELSFLTTVANNTTVLTYSLFD